MSEKKNHVLLDESIVTDIMDFFALKRYTDYDVGDCVIKHTIGYFNNINPLNSPFEFYDQLKKELGIDGGKIVNMWLIHKYQELLDIYNDFNNEIYVKSEYLQQFDYVDVLNYVLYRLGVNDITTITYNLMGVKKQELTKV